MAQQYDIFTPELLPRLRSMDLFSRSRSNDYLDKLESEHLGLKELLFAAEIELVQFRGIIYRSPNLSEVLSDERDDLERHVECAKSLTAPVRRLPPEILRLIFAEYACGTVNDIGECSRIPGFKLARVCSYWRSVAFSTTELWTRIDVDISSSCSDYHTYPGNTKLVETILSNSLNRPLDISLSVFTRSAGGDPALHPAVSLLFEHAEQINEFTVSRSRNSLILHALARMTKLNKLRIYYVWFHMADISGPPVANHSLEHLHILTRSYTPQSALENLLDGFTLPNLRSLEINWRVDPRHHERPPFMGLWSLAFLLQRSTPPLLHLSLSRVRIAMEVVLDVLRSTPTLQTLQITEPFDAQAESGMFTINFFQRLHVCGSQRPLVPKLSSLKIGVITFPVDLQEQFIRVIQCRHRESDMRDDIDRINSVVLDAGTEAIDDNVVEFFRRLDFLQVVKRAWNRISASRVVI